jgi:hypothetical protein
LTKPLSCPLRRLARRFREAQIELCRLRPVCVPPVFATVAVVVALVVAVTLLLTVSSEDTKDVKDRHGPSLSRSGGRTTAAIRSNSSNSSLRYYYFTLMLI